MYNVQALYVEPWQSTFRTLHGFTIAHICTIQATMATSDGVRMVIDWLGHATYNDRQQKCGLIEINGTVFDVTWTITFENVHILKY